MIDLQIEKKLMTLLKKLETKIEPAQQQKIRQRHISNAMWLDVDRPPLLIRCPWDQQVENTYTPAEAIADPAKMLTNEFLKGFTQISRWLKVQDDTPLQIRPDFGIGVVPAMFGRCVEASGENPPWVRPLETDNATKAVEEMLDRFDPDLISDHDWFKRIEDTYKYYTEILKDHPNIASSVAITLPDLQGPLDNADLIWGSEVFIALLDKPELVNRLLAAVSDTILQLYNMFSRWTTESEILPAGYCHQHGSIVRGNILLRCDSCVITGPKLYEELIFPYDNQLLESVGGGSFHSCGKWNLTAERIIKSDFIGSLDFGINQSQLNDIDRIYELAKFYKKHLHLIAPREDEIRSGSILKRFPKGITFLIEANDIEKAKDLFHCYSNID
jgi:hypothetical protein